MTARPAGSQKTSGRSPRRYETPQYPPNRPDFSAPGVRVRRWLEVGLTAMQADKPENGLSKNEYQLLADYLLGRSIQVTNMGVTRKVLTTFMHGVETASMIPRRYYGEEFSRVLAIAPEELGMLQTLAAYDGEAKVKGFGRLSNGHPELPEDELR